jgi:pimeloyl-ACP methyl ester carboxylesterase
MKAFTPETRPARITTPDGVELHCEVAGGGTDAVVLPLACWTLPDLLPLVDGRTLVAYDPRGRGASDSLDRSQAFGLDADVADLERVRAALGLERISLVGWSYFGGVAAHYAAAYPARVARLALLSPIPLRRIPWFGQAAQAMTERLDADRMAGLQASARAGRHTANPERFCRDWLRAMLPGYVAEPDAISRMQAQPCRCPNEHPHRLNPLLDRLWQSLGEWDWRAALAQLDVATLVLQGDADFQPREAAEEWAGHLRARLEVVPGAGHMLWVDRREAVLDALGAFLA